jgi:mRNA interferase RelE/StbE
MNYELEFKPKALKEWKKLDNDIRGQFKKKLSKIVKNPKIPSNKLNGYENIYKIKLKSSGYRLAYEVKDDEIIVLVLKVGKRDKFYEILKGMFK